MAYKPPVNQIQSPFGRKPGAISTSINNNNNDDNDNIDKSSGWVTVKSSTYSPATKPHYAYSTSKAPRKFNIKPKNNALAA